MPLSEDLVATNCCEGLLLPLPLRRDSPRDGSRESGLGVVVLRSGPEVLDIGDTPSLARAVMHDRSKRTACSNDFSLSRASWLTWISSESVRFRSSLVDSVRSLT